MVRDASGIRGQTIAIWDFEFVSTIPSRHHANLSISSEDSLGATVAQSKSLYDEVIKKHPSNILSLNHEVIGELCEYCLICSDPFYLCQRPRCK